MGGPAGHRPYRALDLATGRSLADRAEAATSFLARFLGLMGRRSLPAGGGLWLSGANGIHMLFMRFPIDCVFLSRPDGAGRRRVVAVRRALSPWTGIVPFVRGAESALELPVGAVDAAGTAVGNLVELTPAG